MKSHNHEIDDPHNIPAGLGKLLFVGLGIGVVLALVVVALGAAGAAMYNVLA
jgi:hypothetical protein